MRAVTFAAILVLGCTAAAQAQAPVPDLPPHLPPPPPLPAVQPPPPPPAAPAPQASRFRFHRVDDGFVRLDSTTGKIAYCSPHTVGWSCEAVPEKRAALEREIARLHDEIAALRREINDLRAAPPPPPPPAAVPDKPDKSAEPDEQGGITLTLPTREGIAQARAYVEGTLQDTWHRLVEMIAKFQKDVRREG